MKVCYTFRGESWYSQSTHSPTPAHTIPYTGGKHHPTPLCNRPTWKMGTHHRKLPHQPTNTNIIEQPEFPQHKPNAKIMYERSTTFPSHTGILQTANMTWIINQSRPFFGHSHTAPTPVIATITTRSRNNQSLQPTSPKQWQPFLRQEQLDQTNDNTEDNESDNNSINSYSILLL